MTNLDQVTRIKLETDLGRYEFWADRWFYEIQDDGCTLYLRGRGEEARTRRELEVRTQRELSTASLADATPANKEDAE